MARSAYDGWGVEWKYKATSVEPERRFLVGRYWGRAVPPENGSGHKTAVFATRAEARALIARTRSWYSTGRPVRVRVSIESVD